MRQNTYTADDPAELLEVDVALINDAFKAWRTGWDRPENVKADRAAEHFCRTLEMRMGLKSGGGVEIDLPRSKTRWSKMVTTGGTRRLRRDVCHQIYMLNEVDVVTTRSNISIADSMINSTDMVTLGPVRFVGVDDNQNAGEIHVEWISFQGTETRTVNASEFSNAAAGAQASQTVGTVRYFIKNATIRIVDAGIDTPLITDLPAHTRSEFGQTGNIEMRFHRAGAPERWRCDTPPGRDALQGQMSNLRIAEIWRADGARTRLIVTASISDVFPDLDLTGDRTITNQESDVFRTNMERQVFRGRIRDQAPNGGFVLSMAQASFE